MTRRFFRLFIIVMTVFSFISVAEEAAEPLPLDPLYEDIHPMILVNKGSTIFAYHMATYEKPHNVQLLYTLSVKDFSLVQLVRDSNLITIKPEEFNLQRLMRGEKLVVKADAYIGDYQKEGMKVYDGIEISFDKQLYVRELLDVEPSSKKQKYDEVSYNSASDRIYIHQLQQAPSYAQLLHIDLTASCRTAFNTSVAVPKESELLYKFIHCGTITPLYFETEAFVVKEKPLY